MAKKKTQPEYTQEESNFQEKIDEVRSHYIMWREDNETRLTRKNGWNDVTDAYWGKLPADWPYLSKVVDPRIRTSLLEKNARLLNSKLRGRLVPREGGDVLKARLNNAVLDFQWDAATDGGTMLSKWAMMDMDTRLYGSKFGLVWWRYEKDDKDNVIFDGNEFTPLDIRDCGMDPKASHIRDAKWFQHRSWEFIEDLEAQHKEKGNFPGLSLLKQKINENSDRRDNEYESRVLHNKGLTDRVGEDKVFQIVEIVTEYQEERKIVFSPKYNVVLADIETPFAHKKIPIVQLRYYPLGDDALGESEVEPVLSLWRAIQATLCGYLDNMNIHMRPPLKILEGQVRIETIEYGPEAQWLMTSLNAVEEFQGNGDAMRYFQSTYGALVSAFNNAMGDLSQGTSAMDPFNSDKTATEVKQTAKQQNIRDQKNQTDLAEALQDMMKMWLSNNKQFLFIDPEKKDHVLKIVGSQMFEYFKRMGLDELEPSDEAMQMIGEIITAHNGEVSDDDIVEMIEAGSVPKFPVYENEDEKDPEKITVKPKMRLNDMGDAAELSLTPEDLEGMYDYVPDVKSMTSGADAERMEGLQRAIDRVINPQIQQMLMQEGVKVTIKDLIVDEFEQIGLKDAEKYFQSIPAPAETSQMPGAPQPMANQGVPGVPSAPPQGGSQQPMAGSAQLPFTG